MRALVLHRRPLGGLAFMGDAWAWWLAELRGMLPKRLLDIAAARRSRLMVEVTQQEIAVIRRRAGGDAELLRLDFGEATRVGAAALRGAVSPGETVVLRLPNVEALRKIIELPLAGGRNLRKILRFEVGRQSPLDPERICFDHRILRRDKPANKLVVELRIVKREAIRTAVEACRSLGLLPSSLAFSEDEQPFDLADFALGGRASPRRSPWRAVTVVLAGLACLLALASAYVDSARDRAFAHDVAARLIRAKAEAAETERLRKQVEALTVRTEFLEREKAKPLAIRLVNEITRLLPDGTWIFELEIHGSKIRIRGFSPAASQLIAVFDGSPLFSNTRFEASVTQGPRSGLERFDLSFELRKDRP